MRQWATNRQRVQDLKEPPEKPLIYEKFVHFLGTFCLNWWILELCCLAGLGLSSSSSSFLQSLSRTELAKKKNLLPQSAVWRSMKKGTTYISSFSFLLQWPAAGSMLVFVRPHKIHVFKFFPLPFSFFCTTSLSFLPLCSSQSWTHGEIRTYFVWKIEKIKVCLFTVVWLRRFGWEDLKECITIATTTVVQVTMHRKEERVVQVTTHDK